MHVPEDVEERINNAASPVNESIELCCELLIKILQATANCGIPLGINVESLSIYKEEINGAHMLFQRLQVGLWCWCTCVYLIQGSHCLLLHPFLLYV